MKVCRYVICFFLFVVILIPAGQADKVTLSDGSVIMGTVDKMMEGKLYISTKFAGDIAIAASEIQGIEMKETKPVHLSDGSIIKGTVQISEQGAMEVVRTEGDVKFPVQPENVKAIAPPPPPTPTPPQWKGNIIGDLSITEGNSETKGIGLSADATKRSETDRIILRGGYYYSENEGEGTRDDQFIAAKYDYFFDKHLFAYGNTRLDRDAIKELQLRTTGGGGVGYQFLETEKYNLFGETGLSYVHEDYDLDADDATYLAGRAAADFSWWIIQEKLQFQEIAEILLSLDETDDWIGISESNLTWKWTDRWSSRAGIQLEYDNTPATGQDELDTKYTLGIGYSF
ncbi:DUF481 domain-containing protein [bacterium]|nr:DUF481 domain-containing protein [bacterium]